MTKKKFGVYALLFTIIIAGFSLRFFNIDNTPPGVYPDEAVNAADAITANENGNYQMFYPANNGREGLFMNLIAFCFKFFGVSVLTLRLPAILSGTLTILGTYLLTKELFAPFFSENRKERIAIIAAYLVAVSYWAINFSRISFRANLLPLDLVFAFYFLFKGVHTKKYSDFIIGGLIFGIGIHTYIAFRIAPAILVVMLISFTLSRENFLKNYWKQILIFAIFTTIAVLPMLYTFYIHPEYLVSRSASISVLSPEVNGGHPVQTLFHSFGLSLVMFNFWGDQNWRHNFPPYPNLDSISGTAFLFGIIYCLIRFFSLLLSRFKQKIHDEKMDLYVFLIAWFFIMLSPEFLTNEGLPHSLRAIGVLPVVFILAAITIDYIFEYIQKYTPATKKTLSSAMVLILICVGLFNGIKYHIFWADRTEAADAFEKPLMDVSAYLQTLPPEKEKFVIAENMQRIPIQVFNWHMFNLNFVYSGQIEYLEPKTNNFIIIFTDKNDDAISYLENKFPTLHFSEIKDSFGLSFYTLR
jgi:4-amino-4-deoxy-L-arabinose transferase-like glycosyltransferase